MTSEEFCTILKPSIRPLLRKAIYKPGEYLLHEGEALASVFFVLSGLVKVNITTPNGKSKSFSLVPAGSLLGDLEFVMDCPVCCNNIAVTETVCLLLPITQIRRTLRDNAAFMNLIAQNLAERLYQRNNEMALQLYYNLDTKLAAYLLAEDSRPDDSSFNDDNLATVAERLGTSYRHLLRVMSEFCDRGVLKKVARGKYEILNRAELASLAGDYTLR